MVAPTQELSQQSLDHQREGIDHTALPEDLANVIEKAAKKLEPLVQVEIKTLVVPASQDRHRS